MKNLVVQLLNHSGYCFPHDAGNALLTAATVDILSKGRNLSERRRAWEPRAAEILLAGAASLGLPVPITPAEAEEMPLSLLASLVAHMPPDGSIPAMPAAL